MTLSHDPLSPTQILAAATSYLSANGFVEVTQAKLSRVESTQHRIFEDAYCVVLVTVFESWNDLQHSWINAQSAFVELMSEFVPKDAPKSWDGYLVVLTPGLVPLAEKHAVEHIRYDTGRVRKLIATGEQIKEVSDVEYALLPLLPLQENITPTTADGALSRLPELLEGPTLSREAIKTVIESFTAQEPLVEALHNQRGGL